LKIPGNPPVHLTYCLNVHSGEHWTEILEAIRTVTLAIREKVAPRAPFGLGLRLGHLAADTLSNDETLDHFRMFLKDHGLYVFTITGFPYGEFHRAPVKKKVYEPDWRQQKRLLYTKKLADILKKLLPEGIWGSISTVPGSYKEWIRTPDHRTEMVANLMDCVAHLSRIFEKTGKEIHLGLEPEPDCFMETTEEVVRFFTRYLREEGTKYLVRLSNCSKTDAAESITRHLGVCFDTCHMSLQYENLTESISTLHAHGIRLSKIQISAALQVDCSEKTFERLRDFCDPIYLHQVKARCPGGRIESHEDLSTALSRVDLSEESEKKWRVHFHVPLYFTGDEELKTTSTDMPPAFFEKARACGCDHFEIETYTFDVFPEKITTDDMAMSIAREYEWVLERIGRGELKG
jgi:sugar phosphate isomerase/epimerase